MCCDRRLFGGLLLVSAFVSLVAAGCSDITPEANNEGGGVLESPTNEADTMRQQEEQQQENQMNRQEQQQENQMNRGGGGGGRR
jgi:hypothetical protein